MKELAGNIAEIIKLKSEIIARKAPFELLYTLNPFSCFSHGSREIIGKRDHWSCQTCGASPRRTGDFVEASHLPEAHFFERPAYNNPNNGEIQCIRCHLIRHIEMHLDLDNEWSFYSLRLITTRAWENGLHKREIYARCPETMEIDHEDIEIIFKNSHLNLEHYIIPEDSRERLRHVA